jgi:recombination protein RecT
MAQNTLADQLETTHAARQAGAGERAPTVADLMVKLRPQVEKAIVKALDPTRFLSIVLTEMRKNRQLFNCTPESLTSCILEAAQLGLTPGPLGHCYLVPYRNNKTNRLECTLILGYKGLIDLARRSGNIVSVIARPVYESDEFEFSYGLNEVLVHKPNMAKRGEKVVAYYGVAHYRDGGHTIMVMSPEDIARYRKRSRAASNGPWVTDTVAMGCKTVIRRMATFMPLSVEAQERITVDDTRDLELDDIIDMEAIEAQENSRPALPDGTDPETGEKREAATEEQAQGTLLEGQS